MKVHAADGKQGALLPPPSEAILQRDEWRLAQRITATPPFQRSVFLTNFLLYICDRKLSNHEEEISEHQIGVQALGRPAAYHPGEDNIVRNYARILRRQLDEYFAHEGRDEPLRIVIPRGRYVPRFEANVPPEAPEILPARAEAPPLPQPPVTAKGSQSLRRSFLSFGSAAIALLLAVVLAAGWVYNPLRARTPTPDLYAVFWKELAGPGRATYIVTGDSGFALLQDMTRHQIPLTEYVNGDFDKWFPKFDVSMQRADPRFNADRLSGYTSVADLNAVAALIRLPEVATADVVVRNAREIHVGEIRRANLILLGGPLANPWAELLESNANFVVQFSPQRDERSIVNLHPRPGEQPIYERGGDVDPQRTYVTLSFVPNLDGNGHALLIQGLNISGTQAGADFLLNEKAMLPILRQARLPDGSIGRFELLIQTQSIGASAANAHPVIVRCGPGG